MLSPGAERALRDLSAPSAVLLLVGPEGGLDPEEQEIAATCGFHGGAARTAHPAHRDRCAGGASRRCMRLWGIF